MTDPSTTASLDKPDDPCRGQSGNWQFKTTRPDLMPRNWSALRLTAGSLVLLATSSTSIGADPWATGEAIPTTLSSPFEPVQSQRISSSRARQMAIAILRKAEAERLRIDAEEARKGIDWEHTA